MRNKFLLVSLVALLALVLGACAPAAGGNTPAVRNLTVNGMGQATLTPDMAYIYIGVNTKAPTAAQAVAQNNTQTQKVVDALKKAGVADVDIRTSNFSIWPSQEYNMDGTPGQTFYMVDNTVYIVVRDLAKLGDLLDQTVRSGANTINSIQFDVADKSQALSDARKAAVENAKVQAQELAGAAGVRLGDIQSISYYDSVPYPVFDGKGGGAMAENALAVPINPGQMTLSVNVTLVFEIK
jgi:uncharacterized protein